MSKLTLKHFNVIDNTFSPTEFYLIHLPEPLQPKAQQTLSISYSILSILSPVPATINQFDKQYVQYTFSAYTPSAYVTEKQKTKVKFPRPTSQITQSSPHQMPRNSKTRRSKAAPSPTARTMTSRLAPKNPLVCDMSLLSLSPT